MNDEFLVAERRLILAQGRDLSQVAGTIEPLPAFKGWESETIMADTYTSLYYHIVFGTKGRVGYIKPEIEQHIWEYIGIAREKQDERVAGRWSRRPHSRSRDRSADLSLARLRNCLKAAVLAMDSHQISRTARFRVAGRHGAFTVSKSSVLDVQRYIQNQRSIIAR